MEQPMSKAANHSTSKNINMNTVVSEVLSLAAGALLDDQEEIRAAAEALANECGINLSDFGFAV
jgi:hypothetical protein